MNLSAIGALALRVCLFVLSLALSPLGYAKELAILAIVIWLGSVAVSTTAKTWSPANDPQLAAAANRPAIARIMLNPDANLTCMFQDFSHVVALDDATGDIFFSHEAPGAHRYELGCDRDGWGFLTLSGEQRLLWWHSIAGPIELLQSESLRGLKDITMSRTARTVSAINFAGNLTTWRLTPEGDVLRAEGTLPPRTDRIVLSPDGQTLAVKSVANQLAFHRAEDGARFSAPLQMDSLVVCSAWSADSAWFAAGLERNKVQILRPADPAHPPQTIELNIMPTAIVLSDDGRWLIATTSSGEIEGWHDGERVWSGSTSPTIVRALDISADNQRVVAGGVDGKILTFATTTGALVDTKFTVEVD